MNDLHYYESQGFSHQEAKDQVAADRASTSLLLLLFSFFLRIVTLCFLFMPGIFCAYLILYALRTYLGNPKGWDYFWWMIGIVYLVECIVFLLKGWSMTLKDKGNGAWMFLWGVCFIYCFALPVLMLHALIFDQFKHPPGQSITRLEVLCWAGAAILSWLIYRRYSLGTDNAPKWMLWAYRLGRRIGA
jgi:hypothetical protein